MNLVYTIEPLYPNLVMGVYSEVKDNSIKANALNVVKGLVNQGAIVYKVEDSESNTFVGVSVRLNQQEVFSFNRKSI